MNDLLRRLIKVAGAGESTGFNETTPNANENQSEEQKAMAQQPVTEDPTQSGAAPQDYAAVPTEQEVPATSPGVAATQEFLAPIMEQAMAGDQNAKDIVARTAGEMAAAVERTVATGAAAQTAAAPSPEEQVANGVVPPESAQAAPAAIAPATSPEAKPSGTTKTSSYITVNDIRNALNLFRR